MIAFLTLELRIEHAQSLKDKRQVVRSLKDRLGAHFNVAVAELDSNGLWNRATLGVVSVSDSRDYLDGLMKNVERHALRIANNGGAEVADSFVECLWAGGAGVLACRGARSSDTTHHVMTLLSGAQTCHFSDILILFSQGNVGG